MPRIPSAARDISAAPALALVGQACGKAVGGDLTQEAQAVAQAEFALLLAKESAAGFLEMFRSCPSFIEGQRDVRSKFDAEALALQLSLSNGSPRNSSSWSSHW